MKLLFLFVAAQLAGNGITLLIPALAWHITRPRLQVHLPLIVLSDTFTDLHNQRWQYDK